MQSTLDSSDTIIIHLQFCSLPLINNVYTLKQLNSQSVQPLSHVQLFATPWTAACHASLSFLPPGVCSNLCPLSQWCHPTISSSVIPFSSCLQSFLASRSFQMSQLFASGGQSIGASTSASVLPVNVQGWFPFGVTRLILLSKGLFFIHFISPD